MSVRMIGDDLEFEVVRSDDPSIIVLVESSLPLYLFGGLSQFALPKQTQAFRIIEFFAFRILVDLLDHHSLTRSEL